MRMRGRTKRRKEWRRSPSSTTSSSTTSRGSSHTRSRSQTSSSSSSRSHVRWSHRRSHRRRHRHSTHGHHGRTDTQTVPLPHQLQRSVVRGEFTTYPWRANQPKRKPPKPGTSPTLTRRSMDPLRHRVSQCETSVSR